jgi:hypothetical protein
MGNRHCKSARTGGKPDKAVGFISEGSPFKTRFLEELDPELAAMGVSAEEWSTVQMKLREAYGIAKSKLKAAIESLNESLFTAKGCIAVYAEYGMGQKAMTVYTQEAWDSLPE